MPVAQNPSPFSRAAPLLNRNYASYALASLLLIAAVGMFYAHTLDVNAPPILLSPKLAMLLAGTGITLLVITIVRRLGTPWRRIAAAFGIALIVITASLIVRTYTRYQTAPIMHVPVREFTNAEYAEDPANRSVHFGKYKDRSLTLIQKDATHFDFVFEPNHPHIAKVVFRDIDVSLMTPGIPAWTQHDAGLRRIALTDRQWNRQQVKFGGPGSVHVEVTGGDGFEAGKLYSAELAKNCLNAGLWEVLLFVKENNDKALYYQGWFTFPLGHYAQLFEQNTGLAYWRHWYYLEHWFGPAGTRVPMNDLRKIVSEREVAASFDKTERIIAASEQGRKRRTAVLDNVVSWGDFYDGRPIRFASFIPPGRYSAGRPWKNKYRELKNFEKAVVRQIATQPDSRALHEIELVFSNAERNRWYRIFVSGIDLQKLPQLPMQDYPKGLYMPMGIGVPPFYQSYEDLKKSPPATSPYVSVMLDTDDRWIDHHAFAIDGPVLHRDEKNPRLLHVYLLSYERHSLVAHITVPIDTL